MKILVCTNEMQGYRASDFCWTVEGEIAGFGFTCASGHGNLDKGCGCQRSFVGCDSHKATTTALVVDRQISAPEFIERYLQCQRDCGWLRDNSTSQDILDYTNEALELLRHAEDFPVGTVLEKRGNEILPRG